MTQKYTPAPWIINNEFKTSINNGNKHIAMVNYYKCGNPEIDVYGEEHEANARLIAAAPEMLKALEEIIFLVENGHINISGIQSQYQKIRETVAKAKGES